MTNPVHPGQEERVSLPGRSGIAGNMHIVPRSGSHLTFYSMAIVRPYRMMVVYAVIRLKPS